MSLILSKFATTVVDHRPQITPPLSSSSSSSLTQLSYRRRRRGLSLVTRGAPGPSTYIFAFVFPFSLIAGTIFTSIQVSDKLDRQFLEELLVNKAILEDAVGDDDDDADDFDDDEEIVFVSEETKRPRNRNRPKREAEV